LKDCRSTAPRAALRLACLAALAAAAGCMQVKDDGLDHGGGDGCEYCHAGVDQLGAHAVHVHATGDYAAEYACTECHPVTADAFTNPGDGAVHAALGVAFSQSALAAANGAAPAFDASSRRCSGVYCHGAALGGGDYTDPKWVDDETLADGIACGDCHGQPPPSPHPQEDGDSCGDCHAMGSGGAPDPDTHIDGTVQFGSDDKGAGTAP
jgi:predicted CxxxxCH...CXXCH cytochrome family protein